MTIPQAAIDAAATAVHQEINLDTEDGSEIVRECNGTCDGIAEGLLRAAFPHLLADYRERLILAESRILAMRGGEVDRLKGKAEGIRLALSYLDEIGRES